MGSGYLIAGSGWGFAASLHTSRPEKEMHRDWSESGIWKGEEW